MASSICMLFVIASVFSSSMKVKRTLFVNGISQYAEEREIKQHFE